MAAAALAAARAALWRAELARVFKLLAAGPAVGAAAAAPRLGAAEVAWLCRESPLLRAVAVATADADARAASEASRCCAVVITATFPARPPCSLDHKARAAVAAAAANALVGHGAARPAASSQESAAAVVLADVRPWPLWGSAAAPEPASAAAAAVAPRTVAVAGGSAVGLLVRGLAADEAPAMAAAATANKRLEKAMSSLGLGKCVVLHAVAAASASGLPMLAATGSGGGRGNGIDGGCSRSGGQTSVFAATGLRGASPFTVPPFPGLWSAGFWVPADGGPAAAAQAKAEALDQSSHSGAGGLLRWPAAAPGAALPFSMDLEGFMAWANTALACRCSAAAVDQRRKLHGGHGDGSDARSAHPLRFASVDALLGVDARAALLLAAQVSTLPHLPRGHRGPGCIFAFV
jgi:hypothetical protein